jgi:hypothetical protein
MLNSDKTKEGDVSLAKVKKEGEIIAESARAICDENAVLALPRCRRQAPPPQTSVRFTWFMERTRYYALTGLACAWEGRRRRRRNCYRSCAGENATWTRLYVVVKGLRSTESVRQNGQPLSLLLSLSLLYASLKLDCWEKPKLWRTGKKNFQASLSPFLLYENDLR